LGSSKRTSISVDDAFATRKTRLIHGYKPVCGFESNRAANTKGRMHAYVFDIPAGQSFRKVRDFLRRNAHPRLFDSQDVAEYFGVDVTAELLAKGLIEPEVRYEGKFQITSLGTRLATKRLIPRIPRARQKRSSPTCLRARALSMIELLCRISKITVFGSFLTDAEDLGDIDVAVELKRKDIDGMRWTDAALARAKASGRQLDYRQMLGYPEREVKQLLKKRSRYIQLCSPVVLEDFNTPKRVIFSDETN
jgi:predicted nucleotidyltransferase